MQLSNSAPQARAGSSSQTTGIAVSNAKTFQSPTVLEPKTGEKPTLPLPSIFKEGPRRFRFASIFPDGAAQRHRVVGGGDIGRRFCRVKRFFKKSAPVAVGAPACGKLFISTKPYCRLGSP